MFYTIKQALVADLENLDQHILLSIFIIASEKTCSYCFIRLVAIYLNVTLLASHLS